MGNTVELAGEEWDFAETRVVDSRISFGEIAGVGMGLPPFLHFRRSSGGGGLLNRFIYLLMGWGWFSMASEFRKELLRRLRRKRRLWLRILVCCWNRTWGIGTRRGANDMCLGFL